MVKIVESGCRDCTVTLDGTECAVEFPANYRVFSVQNMSDSDIIMSVESGKTAADDGVRIVEAGGVGSLNHMRSDINTVYITGTGKVQISAGNEAVLPFRSAAKGGDTVSASGNPVQLSGLQGGVPFAMLSVSGEGIIGQEITVSACGKNLIPYPYAKSTETINGVSFTDNGDGTITVCGTATNTIWYGFSQIFRLVKGVKYTFSTGAVVTGSGTPIENGGQIANIAMFDDLSATAVKQYAFPAKNTDKVSFTPNYEFAKATIRIDKGVNVDGIIYKPMLEVGADATEYEPYHGSTINITPDSNPYTIPNDIRQQEGLNNISVSAGELSVVGMRKNAAIKRIYDDFSLELLFDGLARADSPAVGVDFSKHSKFIVSNYLNTLSSKCDYAGTVLIERDRLESLISNASFLDVPVSTQYSVQNHFSGTISNASFYAVQSMDSSALYATRIYGIR